QDVGNALIPFALEMVLGQPQDVITSAIHQASNGGRLVEGGRQALVRQPAIIHWSGVETVAIQVHVAGVQAAEASNHGMSPWLSAWREESMRPERTRAAQYCRALRRPGCVAAR